MSRLRTLIVQGAAQRAGAEAVLLGRVRHLPEFEVTPTVAFLAEGPFVDEVARLGVDVEVLASAPARVRHPWRISAQVARVAALARDRRSDVIEGCGEKMAIWAGWAARRARCASVFRLHDEPLRSLPAAVTQLGAVAAPHDAVVVPSRWMADAFRRRLRLDASVIPNGLALERLPAEATGIRAELGWPADALIVAMCGRLESWKGQDVFLRAAAEVAAVEPRARFLVVGGALYGWDQRYAAHLPRLAGDLGIADVTRFLGHRADALAVMAAADVVCHCSTRPEPFGMVVIEALALGRAVIASTAGGPSEILDHGRTGLLVAPGDVHALAAAMANLLASPDRRRRLAAAGRAVVRERFTARRMAQQFAAVYRHVASTHSIGAI